MRWLSGLDRAEIHDGKIGCPANALGLEEDDFRSRCMIKMARFHFVNFCHRSGRERSKDFFEAKIDQQMRSNKFHDKIRQEHEERRREDEMRVNRRLQFQQPPVIFQ